MCNSMLVMELICLFRCIGQRARSRGLSILRPNDGDLIHLGKASSTTRLLGHCASHMQVTVSQGQQHYLSPWSL